MKLIDSLIKRFGYNTPFMLSEIQKEDYSKQQIIKEVTKLCEAKKVIRFERGMYYIPRKTKFGTSFFNQNKVIEKKYISNGKLVKCIVIENDFKEKYEALIKNPFINLFKDCQTILLHYIKNSKRI